MPSSSDTKTDQSTLAQRLPFADSKVLKFFDSWMEARGDRLVPYRQQYSPISIGRLLSSVWLYQYDPLIGDFVCVLSGESVNEAWGGNINGLTLRQIVGEQDHPVVLQRWRRIVEIPAIHYGTAEERLSAQDLRRAERLILPLSEDNDEICAVIGISLYSLGPVDIDRRALHPEDIIQIPCSEL